MKIRWIRWAVPVVLLTAATGWLTIGTIANTRRPDPGQIDVRESEIIRGLRIAPVELDLHGKNLALVGRGSYIVNAVAGCADCHSCPTYEPGHNPYQGGDGKFDAEHYLAGGVPFGPFVSANITPDASGRPAGLTFEEFENVIRTGENHTLFVMPWPIYRNMVDRDLRAIYEYLTAIPHADPGQCGGAGE